MCSTGTPPFYFYLLTLIMSYRASQFVALIRRSRMCLPVDAYLYS
eukprot:gene9831-6904_t